MVDRAKIQRTGQREVDDTQAALQKLTDQVNASPLAIDSLPYNKVSLVDDSWVALGATQTDFPLLTVTEPGSLTRAVFSFKTAVAANAVDFRTFSLLLYRAGALVSTLATRSTATVPIEALKPFELTLATQENDRRLLKDDVVTITIAGGGVLPAITSGDLTLYILKGA